MTSTEANLFLDSKSIVVLPNPTQGFFKIEGLLGDYTIEILDATGAVFQTLTTSSNSLSVDISALPSGMYFISVANNTNGVISAQKILKQ